MIKKDNIRELISGLEKVLELEKKSMQSGLESCYKRIRIRLWLGRVLLAGSV